MHWWDYPSIAGILLAATLPWLPRQYVPLAVAVALHLILDFTLQSEWATTKATNRRALLVHSLLAGFLPLAGLGLAAGDPGLALVGGLVGFAAHLAIDSRDKFGLPLWPGLAVDQVGHLVIVAVFAVIAQNARAVFRTQLIRTCTEKL